MNINELVMVVSNAFRPDPRVYREAKTLVDHGFKVTVYAWDRECKHPMNEIIDGIFVERIQVRSKYGSFFEFIITIPIFWLFTSLKILAQSVSVVHCHDFDTIPVGILVKMLRRNVKIVYDAHEIYPAMVASEIPHILYTLLRWVDKIFMRAADCVIIPSEERKIFYTYARRLIVVPNTPKFTEIREEPKEGEFSIFYGGGLSRENGILIMIKAIIGIPHVKLTLAGDGPLRCVIERICKKNNNLRYLGLINQKDVLKNLARADVTFVFYEPTNINNMYPASNKLFEAMMVGVPVIANRETSLSKIIEKYKCGILVPYGDVQILKNELIKLKRNPLLRKTLGENGKRAFKEKFAWDVIEMEFISKYKEMLYRG